MSKTRNFMTEANLSELRRAKQQRADNAARKQRLEAAAEQDAVVWYGWRDVTKGLIKLRAKR